MITHALISSHIWFLTLFDNKSCIWCKNIASLLSISSKVDVDKCEKLSIEALAHYT